MILIFQILCILFLYFLDLQQKLGTYLAEKNPHPRDSNITFDEGPHIYTINGDSSFTSVTTWNHSHFEQLTVNRFL